MNEASNCGVRVYTFGLDSPDEAVVRTQGRAMRMRLDEETLKTIVELHKKHDISLIGWLNN